jgi:hypothetical protein
MSLIIIESGNIPTGQVFDAVLCDGDRRAAVRAKRVDAENSARPVSRRTKR